MLVAALVVTPTAVAAAGPRCGGRPSWPPGPASGAFLSDPVRGRAAGAARLSTRVFGIWMSLEPAVAALIGLALLGQHLSVSEWAAVGCVVVACVGAARSAPRLPRPICQARPQFPPAPDLAAGPPPSVPGLGTQRHNYPAYDRDQPSSR